MARLKKGTVMICHSNILVGSLNVPNLTIGEKYILENDEQLGMPFYELKNDLGIQKAYLKDYFKPLDQHRLDTIDNIIND